MQLQEKHGDKVLGIAFNVEFDGRKGATQLPDKDLAKIKQMINDRQINCRNIISTDVMDEVLKELDLFGIPAVLVYDADGKLAKKFDGEFDYKNDVAPMVAELVAASKSNSPKEDEGQEPAEAAAKETSEDGASEKSQGAGGGKDAE